MIVLTDFHGEQGEYKIAIIKAGYYIFKGNYFPTAHTAGMSYFIFGFPGNNAGELKYNTR